MNALVHSSAWLLAACVVLAGCGKKTDKTAEPAKKPNKPVKEEHAKGPHGGHLFDVGPGHKYMGELVVSKEPRKLELYLVDHEDQKKAVMSGSKAITITSIKVNGKPVPDVTLDMAPLKTDKDGSSHFVVSGEKLPKEIDDEDALNGAKFKVLIDGKSIEATIEAHHDE